MPSMVLDQHLDSAVQKFFNDRNVLCPTLLSATSVASVTEEVNFKLTEL